MRVCANCKRERQASTSEPGAPLSNLCEDCRKADLLTLLSRHEPDSPPLLEENAQGGQGANLRPLREPLPVSFELRDLKARLKRAVEAERYELAARIRDTIAKLEQEQKR